MTETHFCSHSALPNEPQQFCNSRAAHFPARAPVATGLERDSADRRGVRTRQRRLKCVIRRPRMCNMMAGSRAQRRRAYLALSRARLKMHRDPRQRTLSSGVSEIGEEFVQNYRHDVREAEPAICLMLASTSLAEFTRCSWALVSSATAPSCSVKACTKGSLNLFSHRSVLNIV